MNKRNAIGPGMIWLQLLLIMGIAMVIGQNPTWAGCPPVDAIVDSDGDGFTDQEECANLNTAFKLDPNKKDLFVIVVPASPSSLPSDPLMYLKALTSINVHQITAGEANPDRTIKGLSSSQKAVRITESLDPYDPLQPLGFSWEGTPNTRDDATVYTLRIKGHIESACNCALASCGSNCRDHTGTTNAVELYYKYMRHTIAHEIGHMIRPLANVSQRDYTNFGGYHYKSGTKTILDQSVSYTTKSGITTFYLGTTFTQSDMDSVTLK